MYSHWPVLFFMIVTFKLLGNPVFALKGQELQK